MTYLVISYGPYVTSTFWKVMSAFPTEEHIQFSSTKFLCLLSEGRNDEHWYSPSPKVLEELEPL